MDEAHYAECIANGCSPRLAEMFASGRAPTAKTDDTFFKGWSKTGGAQFTHPEVRAHYLAEARRAGVSVTGKQYFSELAEYPGDPRAWVDSRGEMVRLLEERNWACSGDLTVRREPTADPEPVALAEDLVAEKVAERLEETPDAKVEDVREQVIETHAPHWTG